MNIRLFFFQAYSTPPPPIWVLSNKINQSLSCIFYQHVLSVLSAHIYLQSHQNCPSPVSGFLIINVLFFLSVLSLYTSAAYSHVVENTAFFGDVALRFPRIVHHYYDRNADWGGLLRWGLNFCNLTGVFTGGAHQHVLTLVRPDSHMFTCPHVNNFYLLVTVLSKSSDVFCK